MMTLFQPSRISQACLDTESCTIGIDEAGRGPVLGPLVYSAFVSPTKNLPSLVKDYGAADSKKLTIDQRNEMFLKYRSDGSPFSWATHSLSPEVISSSMMRKEKYNLNSLSYNTVFGLIEDLLSRNIRIKEAFVDTLGSPEKYQASLSEKFPTIQFTVRPKADDLYPIVGAASVVAKVLRDSYLVNLINAESPEDPICGSGYPSDPDTIKWLKRNLDSLFGFSPKLVRLSWSSAIRLLESESEIYVEWPNSEEDHGKVFKKTRCAIKSW